jgi:hypothetical protein
MQGGIRGPTNARLPYDVEAAAGGILVTALPDEFAAQLREAATT